MMEFFAKLIAAINVPMNAVGKNLFGFKTLTMAPIDRTLIKTSLLNEEDLEWLNNYHAKVRETLLPRLEKVDPKAAKFLIEATKPL